MDKWLPSKHLVSTWCRAKGGWQWSGTNLMAAVFAAGNNIRMARLRYIRTQSLLFRIGIFSLLLYVRICLSLCDAYDFLYNIGKSFRLMHMGTSAHRVIVNKNTIREWRNEDILYNRLGLFNENLRFFLLILDWKHEFQTENWFRIKRTLSESQHPAISCSQTSLRQSAPRIEDSGLNPWVCDTVGLKHRLGGESKPL